MRLLSLCLLGNLCVLVAAHAAAAPVPKSPPPPAHLTADHVVGAWHYEWADWLDGAITFGADGQYAAIHQPAGDTAYFGTWRLDGDTVVLAEWQYSISTGGRYGPTEYRFAFAAKDYPRLTGLSNDTTRVALSKPKR